MGVLAVITGDYSGGGGKKADFFAYVRYEWSFSRLSKHIARL